MKKKLLYLVIILAPAIACVLYIFHFGANGLFGDDWDIVPLVQKIKESSLRFSDLYAQHFEHRLFFMRLIYLGLVFLSDFNTITVMLFSVFLLFIVALIITNYIFKRTEVSKTKKILVASILAFVMFSLTQFETFLWAFSIVNMIVLLFTVLSLYCLCNVLKKDQMKHRNWYFAVALIAGVVDSFTDVYGLITWVTGSVLMLLVLRRKSLKSPYFVIWNIVAIFSWIAYFSNYVKPPQTPSASAALDNPGMFIQYYISILGNAIVGNLKSLVIPTGILILVFLLIGCMIIWKRKQIQAFLFPLALAFNSLFVLGSIAYGRVGFGIEQALSSRYVTFSLYAVVGVCLIWMELQDKKKKIIGKKIK
jgi:hypothetical protein